MMRSMRSFSRSRTDPRKKQESVEIFGSQSNSASLSLALELETRMALERGREMAQQPCVSEKDEKEGGRISRLFQRSRSSSRNNSQSRSRSRSNTRRPEDTSSNRRMSASSRIRKSFSKRSSSKRRGGNNDHQFDNIIANPELLAADQLQLQASRDEQEYDSRTVGTMATSEAEEKYSNDIISFVLNQSLDDATIDTDEDSEEEEDDDDDSDEERFDEGQETIWAPDLENGEYTGILDELEQEEEMKIDDDEGQEAIWEEKVTFVATSKQLRTAKISPKIQNSPTVKKTVVLPGPSNFPIATINF